MASVLYQTFYRNNKFDNVSDIGQLHKWMLSKEWMAVLLSRDNPRTPTLVPSSGVLTSSPSPANPSIAISPEQTRPAKRVVIPNKGDTLFWCVYICHYGEDTYLAIGNKYGNAEIAEKKKIMEFLKSNKCALKNVNRKITLSAVQEIMSDLMTNVKTSLQTVVALSVFYKKNIMILNECNKTYIEYLFDLSQKSDTDQSETIPTTKWLVIQYTENKQYGVISDEETDVSNYCNKYIHIENYDKPLKGISTYKMSELTAIASNIPELTKEGKWTKPELYGKLWHHCLWV